MSTTSLSPTQFNTIAKMAQPHRFFGENEHPVHGAISEYSDVLASRKKAAGAPADASTEEAAASSSGPMMNAMEDAAGAFKVTAL